MNPELMGYILIMLAGLIMSALYSGLETGLYTINRVRLMVRASHQERSAVRLRKLLNNPNHMLATLLLGNNIANYAGSFGIAAMLNYHGVGPGKAILINAGILIPLLFIFGETLPKDLFRTHTDRWSYRFSWLLILTSRLLTVIGLVPLVRGFGALLTRFVGGDAAAAVTARQRMSQLIKEGLGAGVLSEHQTTLADRALALRDRSVGSEMIPWAKVNRVPLDASPSQRYEVVAGQRHNRLPVVDRSGKAVGLIAALDCLLDPQRPTKELLIDTIELTPEMPVREALRQMRRDRCPLAIVVNRTTNKPIGIVTFKDLVEPLTGELAAW
jgi:putative hemolysin